MVSKSKKQTVYYCLSTDTKPTDRIGNGDVLIEMDTGKVYLYDADGAEWLEVGGS